MGDRPDSNKYINMKVKAGKEIGVTVSHVKLPKTITEREVFDGVKLIFDLLKLML